MKLADELEGVAMDLTYRELRELSDDQVVDMYDAEAERVGISLNFLRDELLRREQANQAATIVKLTWWITLMTVVVTVATVVNVIIAVRGQP